MALAVRLCYILLIVVVCEFELSLAGWTKSFDRPWLLGKVNSCSMSHLPIAQIIHNYQNLNTRLATTSATQELIELSKEQKRLTVQYDLAVAIDKLEQAIGQNQILLEELSPEDLELSELLKAELAQQREDLQKLEDELMTYLSPEDERDAYNVLLEIRAGAGGDESSIFAAEMLRMYQYLATRIGLSFKVTTTSANPEGGYKEVMAEIRGDQAYAWFKYEGGVHRVQRVPVTEKQGRIHTSTVSVAIMPLLEKDHNFQLDMKEVEIITSTSQGAGGQSVNTTYSAVRVRHLPTGIEARSQDERNQQQNKEKALQVLTSRVFNFYEEQRIAKENAQRLQQVGRADRSEKIRTYNFPQDRLTDHRYNRNWSNLLGIMNGDILEVIKTIRRIEAEQALAKLTD